MSIGQKETFRGLLTVNRCFDKEFLAPKYAVTRVSYQYNVELLLIKIVFSTSLGVIIAICSLVEAITGLVEKKNGTLVVSYSENENVYID